MTRVIVDASLLEKLNNLTEEIELCDRSGKFLGRVLPAAMEEETLYEKERPTISIEEMKCRVSKGGGRNLAEILADLEKQ